MKPEEIKAICNRDFATHKATLIQNTDRFCIIDWRRADGSGNCYVNYIVDKARGSLIVSGDLGDSIATWYNPLDPAKLKGYIHNDIGYYIGKIQCSSDLYNYDEDDVVKEIKAQLDESDVAEYVEESDRFDDKDEFWEFVEDEVSDSIYRDMFIPTQYLREVIGEIDCDCFEWLGGCGKSISPRVYLWAEGFYMACNQLGI